METPIVNRVAQSGIITLELETYMAPGEWIGIDLKNYLFEELILREKDFREKLANTDWTIYSKKNIAVYCSADAIIPLWAWMLITTYLQPFASTIQTGTIVVAKEKQMLENLRSQLNPTDYKDLRVVIKGCSDETVPESAYLEITRLLQPVVKSLMFGEACSTVPIYKRK